MRRGVALAPTLREVKLYQRLTCAAGRVCCRWQPS